MTEAEFLHVVIKITELRLNPQYQAAERLRRTTDAASMAAADQNTDPYAAIRLLIGTWERIAIFAKSFSKVQLRRFFRCTPMWLVWLSLEPAIVSIRNSRDVGPRFGKELEDLAKVYHEWSQGPDGKDFRSEVEQAVCANFV